MAHSSSQQGYKNDPNWKRFVSIPGDYEISEWQCNVCIHRFAPDNPIRCKAFPKGIPSQIFDREHDHSKPFRGDGGIRFERIEDGE